MTPRCHLFDLSPLHLSEPLDSTKFPDPDIHLGTTAVDNAAPWSNDREAQKRTSQSLARLPIVANRTALNEFENQVGSLTVRTGTSLPDRISRTVGSESAAVSGAG